MAVSWSEPDQGDSEADEYDFRYSTSSLTEGNWSSATQVATGSPGAQGTPHCVEVYPLTQCTQYYFGVKTKDGGLWSAISNVASGSTRCSGNLEATCGGEGLKEESGGMALVEQVTAPTYEFALGPARPNPSRGTVTIAYSLAQETPVSIRLYDMAGRLVKTLVQGMGHAGPHEVVWDARDDGGRAVPAGVYFYKMLAGSWGSQRKVVFWEK